MHQFVTNSEFKLELQSGNSQSGQNRRFLPCVTLKFDGLPWNTRSPFLCYFKLWASFPSHMWNKTGVSFRYRSIRVKVGDFLSRVTSKCDGWPSKTSKTRGHLFHAVKSFVHHFVAIGEFKLELPSGKLKSTENRGILLSRVNLKFDGWP